jgi:hypothetical protein
MLSLNNILILLCSVLASPGALSCKKIFFTSKFSYSLFCNPTHKTEAGTANRWGTTNGEPLLDQLLRWANQKHSVVVRSYLLHSSLHAPCTSHRTLCNDADPKPVLLSQIGIFWLCFIQFYPTGSHTEHHWRCSDSFHEHISQPKSILL